MSTDTIPACVCLTCRRPYMPDKKRPQVTREYCSFICFERRDKTQVDNFIRIGAA